MRLGKWPRSWIQYPAVYEIFLTVIGDSVLVQVYRGSISALAVAVRNVATSSPAFAGAGRFHCTGHKALTMLSCVYLSFDFIRTSCEKHASCCLILTWGFSVFED